MTERSFKEKALYMWPAKVLSLSAAILLYFFTTLFSIENESISVVIRYQFASGYGHASDYPLRTRLTVRGTREQLNAIKEETFQVSADYTSRTEEGRFTTQLKLVALNNPQTLHAGLDISMDPDKVQANIERLSIKELPISAVVEGKPKPGFELAAYYTDPVKVLVQGPESRLRDLTAMETEALVLEHEEQSFSVKKRVYNKDNLLRILNSDMVSVHVSLRSSQHLVVYNDIPIQQIGLLPGLKLEGSGFKGMVRIQTNTDAVHQDDKLPRLVMDLSGITVPGTYIIPVLPDFSGSVTLVDFSPKELQVQVVLQP